MIRLLIVDDEAGFRNAFAKLIHWKQYGYELVGTAENGEKAIEMIEKYECDVVFTDIEMPGIDGIEFMDYLHKNYPEIIIIVLSCYNEFEYARAALQKGAKDYITKLSITPTNIGELLEKIKKLLEENPPVKFKTEYDLNKFLNRTLAKNKNLTGYKELQVLPAPIREVLEKVYSERKFELTLNEAAEIAHVNPQYFSALFKKNINMNFVRYMAELKIGFAEELLINTNMKIYEIGLVIGIDNEAYFSRFFKKYTGMSPNSYKQNRE
ncbi:response regulator [Faecalicatena sp. AGMB00832]|uniref:Response regulator n=1 Tax=Faecalicatena faecalis TaxID=2726362 RepID=A0ABS6CZ16_9FIRM|nr:response regulator [Faecalicatena faecalis]MBU3874508.1 response regulator [Faecalicatena faecalis]